MPELPEVETIRRRLESVLVGHVIDSIEIFKEKSFQGDHEEVIGRHIQKVSRRAKMIRIHLSGDKDLLVHLKMTGQLIYHSDEGVKVGGGHPTADWVSDLPSKHTRVSFSLRNSEANLSHLFFNDMRIFGWVKVVGESEIKKEFEKYAPDIISDQVDEEYFLKKLQKTSRIIKQVIMDNAVIAGVGNIYACDGLHDARIHPERKANQLTREEANKLLGALKSVITQGIELGGATIDNFRNVDGFSGGYQDVVRVYGKAGEACGQCAGIIQKKKIGGRGTYYCSNCQV